MRIVEPSFEVLTCSSPIDILINIERAGRTCYKSKSGMSSKSAEEFIRRIIKMGHLSVIEHESISVRIVCDRGVSHEIVRHRLASYSQESTRYCNYGKDDHLTFIKPCFLPDLPLTEFDADAKMDSPLLCPGHYLKPISIAWLQAMQRCEWSYLYMLKEGCSPQEARSVLPNSLKTEIVMTANLREWRHFFTQRTSSAAHPQMREIARPMLDEFKGLVPVVFDDIIHSKEVKND